MIGWVIRLSVELGGSDAPFWIRLPGPLLHAVTALILGAITARYIGYRAAIVTCLGYATLPMVALGSFLISTDTVMFPFLAGALYCYLRSFDEVDTKRWLVGAGVLLGLAFLSKYAALYFVLMASIAAFFFQTYRPSARKAGIILGYFLLTISPNIVWNLVNGFSTLQHTLDNADWVRDPGTRVGLNAGGLFEFLLSQFMVFGPVLFVALLILSWRALRGGLTLFQVFLLLFSVPIILIVCIQAFLSEAYANWAAAAYLAGSAAVLPFLLDRLGWLKASFIVNGSFCILIPILAIFAGSLRFGGDRLIMARYAGLDELSEQIFRVAEANDQTVIVAHNRDILADLFYTGRDNPYQIFAAPYEGRPPHHYAMNHSFNASPDTLSALYIVQQGDPIPCDNEQVSAIEMDFGNYRGKTYTVHLIPADCWEQR
nr:glycosyltransferase family 39 protein [Pseudaestuariivita rosea]